MVLFENRLWKEVITHGFELVWLVEISFYGFMSEHLPEVWSILVKFIHLIYIYIHTYIYIYL